MRRGNLSYMDRVLLRNSQGPLTLLNLGRGVATGEEIAAWYETDYDIPTHDLEIVQLPKGMITMDYDRLSEILRARHHASND